MTKTLRNKYIKSGYTAHMNARRRAQIILATPAWANVDEIRELYRECAKITQTTGIPHNVDHIIPLLGRTVCGLHVEINLRIITATENFRRPKIYSPYTS